MGPCRGRDFGKGLAVSGSEDKTLKVWSLRNGSFLRTLEGHDGSVYAVAADFDKGLAVSGSVDKTLKVWSLRNGSVLRTLEGHDDFVYAVAADFDKGLAVSGSWDHTLKVWGQYQLCRAPRGLQCPEGFRVTSHGEGCGPESEWVAREDLPLGCSWKAGSHPMRKGEGLVFNQGSTADVLGDSHPQV